MLSTILRAAVLCATLASCKQTETVPTTSAPAATTPSAVTAPAQQAPQQATLLTGAQQTELYLPYLQGKRVGMVVNQTSTIGKTHLVDTLVSRGVKITMIFAPEHGFRGDADAGAHISNSTDAKTGLPILSLYGKNKKPNADQLKDVDVVLFDIQDVGVRFYTYSSTMHYVMEACAEQNKPMLLLDRPNPIGYLIDGPVLKPGFKSFVGMNTIPISHGLTLGEYAQMINGEKWLKNGVQAQVKIIPVKGYNHKMFYSLPIKPSPNLPNDQSIKLYPFICLFEGTTVSQGRGTHTPFQIIGAPYYPDKSFSFTPVAIPGMSMEPPYKDQVCYGKDLTKLELKENFTLSYLLDFYQKSGQKEKFFNNFFKSLAGTDELQKQVMAGMSEKEIRATWKTDLEAYKKMRKQYLLYPDFE
ncbi:exo-beta-N-acetylmuramidase NamZ family protein [Rufibacter immobilis]|uniref:exo-beta-N-acetylmuramidase NamZ family protein n=1 Tax=Rufibacter immobilis TaxID=1348778 RepID=UPI0035EE52B0